MMRFLISGASTILALMRMSISRKYLKIKILVVVGRTTKKRGQEGSSSKKGTLSKKSKRLKRIIMRSRNLNLSKPFSLITKRKNTFQKRITPLLKNLSPL